MIGRFFVSFRWASVKFIEKIALAHRKLTAMPATLVVWSGINLQSLLLASGDFAAGGDVEGLTVALSSCVAG